jgi:hypothetical protein
LSHLSPLLKARIFKNRSFPEGWGLRDLRRESARAQPSSEGRRLSHLSPEGENLRTRSFPEGWGPCDLRRESAKAQNSPADKIL